MAENLIDTSDPSDHPTVNIKASLKNLEDPLDPQLLENLYLFFKVKGANPDQLIKLYKECISSLGKDWEPFIGTFGATINEGVVACEYFMVGYRECWKVVEEKYFPTTLLLSSISNYHDRMVADHETYRKQQEFWRQQVEDQARQINLLSKTSSELLSTVEYATFKPKSLASSQGSDVSSLSALFSDLPTASWNQFIWEDGKSYKSKIGILTANRDGSITINLASSEFQAFNELSTVIMKPENWEFVLNRDLNELTSYLAINSEQFKDFNNKDISKKADILNELASHVPVNINQWINALDIITERHRCLLPCKTKIEFELRIEGPLPLCNLIELCNIIFLMVLLDSEKSLNVSKLAKPFLWNFMCVVTDEHLTIKDKNKVFLDEAILTCKNGAFQAFSEGLCEENLFANRSVSGDKTWQLTDNCYKYVTVMFSYKIYYSSFPLSERESLKEKEYMNVMRAPSPDARSRLLRMETQLLNVKTTAEQSEFLNPLLYVKRDDLKVALIPTDLVSTNNVAKPAKEVISTMNSYEPTKPTDIVTMND